MSETNWAGNITFRAREVHRPATLDELRRIVAASDRLRALGTRHSFNRIADTTGDLVSTAALPPTVEISDNTVTVAAGLRYGEFVGQLHTAGFALPNLGSLPHLSVAGAVATGTHGSGQDNGNLATAVSGIQFVTAEGDVVNLGRDDADFTAVVVGLGAFGVVTALTLDLEPTFQLAQHVYENLPADQFARHTNEILGAGYSVSLFTDWRDDTIRQVWVKGPYADLDETWLGATRAERNVNPVPGMSGANCTEQLGVTGPWYQRLPHFRLEFTPSAGDELQTEYFVPRENAIDAFRALDRIGARIAPVLRICEIRTVAADDLWLSPAYGRDSAAFHFTWLPDTEAVRSVLTAIEEQLAPYGARPHWGKLFNLDATTLSGRYDRYPDFRNLITRYDPQGKFRNEFIEAYFTE
jgi:alditol oxidase